MNVHILTLVLLVQKLFTQLKQKMRLEHKTDVQLHLQIALLYFVGIMEKHRKANSTKGWSKSEIPNYG